MRCLIGRRFHIPMVEGDGFPGDGAAFPPPRGDRCCGACAAPRAVRKPRCGRGEGTTDAGTRRIEGDGPTGTGGWRGHRRRDGHGRPRARPPLKRLVVCARAGGGSGACRKMGTVIPGAPANVDVFLLALDLVGTFAFAISGATIGVRSRLDLFGVLVLAFVTATFGGIARGVLIGALPPAALSDWTYLALSCLAGLVTFRW